MKRYFIRNRNESGNLRGELKISPSEGLANLGTPGATVISGDTCTTCLVPVTYQVTGIDTHKSESIDMPDDNLYLVEVDGVIVPHTFTTEQLTQYFSIDNDTKVIFTEDLGRCSILPTSISVIEQGSEFIPMIVYKLIINVKEGDVTTKKLVTVDLVGAEGFISAFGVLNYAHFAVGLTYPKDLIEQTTEWVTYLSAIYTSGDRRYIRGNGYAAPIGKDPEPVLTRPLEIWYESAQAHLLPNEVDLFSYIGTTDELHTCGFVGSGVSRIAHLVEMQTRASAVDLP